MLKTITHEIVFKSPPHEVYEAYLDPKKHANFTGAKAKINGVAGGSYSVFGGLISGYNIKLVQDERIIQYWETKSDGWPKGHLSRVDFVLKKRGKGTLMQFTHSNVPKNMVESVGMGWHKYYWAPMKKMLES